MAYNSPQEVLDALVQAYYYERNIETALSCVTDDIKWVGTENNDSAKGKEALRELLENDVAAFPDSFSVALEEPEMQKLGNEAAVLTATGKQIAVPGVVAGFTIRGTACCVKTENGWLINNIHTSVPNSEIEKFSLKQELDINRKKEKTLLSGIPGGVAIYRLKKNGSICTDYVSDGLAKMCGYDTGEEFCSILKDNALSNLVQEDVPLIQAAIQKNMETHQPISVMYHIHTKSGKNILQRLDANLIDDGLGEDDVAMWYGVHTIVSDESKKLIESQKTATALLNAAPVGLGMYEIKDGKLVHDFLNDAFYDMLSSKADFKKQFIGKNTFRLVHPNDTQTVRKFFHSLMDGVDKNQCDFRMRESDNTWIWIHAMGKTAQRRKDYVRIYIAYHECTESKLQQLQLMQNQHAVELAQNQGGLAIWTYNIDKGIIIQQTPMDVEGHLGYPIKIENVPKSFIENGSIYPDDVDKYLAAYEKVAKGIEKVDEVYRMIDQKTGKYSWVHMFYQVMGNNIEGDRMAVGFSMDADKQQEAIERYHMEEKLRVQMYKNAVMYMEYNLMTGRYEGENNLTEIYRSKSWECPAPESYIENMSAAIDEPYLEMFVEKMYAKNLLKAFNNGESSVFCEYRSKPRTGMPSLWYKATAIMAQHPDTGDVMAFVYIMNIEKEKERRLALDYSMSDGIEIISVIQVSDGQARVVRSNYSLTPGDLGEYYTYDEDFVCRSHVSVIAEDQEFSYKAALLSTVLKELEKEDIYQYSISTKRQHGKLKRQLFRFRYLDDRKTAVILSVSDITTLYLEELEKKKQLETALAEVRKASGAKAQFYSRMSHDMRTPMNGILGVAELSKDETNVEVLKENISKIQKSGEYLLSLVNDTLDIQRIESGRMAIEPKIVNTMDVVNNILDMVRVTAKNKGVNLKYSSGNADLKCYIRIDALRLQQIFINLLSNAVKFTPAGGTVEWEFKLHSYDGMISHNVIFVRDTGVGMSKEFLENGIFKPFSQENNAVSSQYAGSGLGLSIAKSLIELMGGRIEVESELGVGTKFAVYLDFERVESSEAELLLKNTDMVRENNSASLQGKKILMAEDHPLNAEIAKKLLQKVGCEIVWAKNGQEAVDFFDKAPIYSFDVILMDIRMPVMDGLEAARKIRSLDKKDAKTVPIIAMTANAYEEDKKASLDAGMNAHLGKPINPNEMYQVLSSYTNK